METELNSLERELTDLLNGFPKIEVAILFGSCAAGRQTAESDLDLGVASAQAISSTELQEISDALAMRFGRPIDLVDLQHAPHVLLREILTTGKRVIDRNLDLLTDLILRMLYNEADLMPYYRQAQKERLEAYFHE